jgi:hypothetical protein
VNDITFLVQLLNDEMPVDLTGTTVSIAVQTPNKTTVNKACTITDPVNGYFSVLLDGDMYSIVGDYFAQFYWYNGDEVNITDKVTYESVLDIPI